MEIPKLTVTTFRFTEEELKRLKLHAKQTARTQNDVIRDFVRQLPVKP